VTAALHLPWSNGPVEGQVYRLKLIKRQMYGRASFDLLRLGASSKRLENRLYANIDAAGTSFTKCTEEPT